MLAATCTVCLIGSVPLKPKEEEVGRVGSHLLTEPGAAGTEHRRAGGRCLGWGYGSKAHTRAACLLSSRKAVGGCTDMVTGQEFRAAATTENAAPGCGQTT